MVALSIQTWYNMEMVRSSNSCNILLDVMNSRANCNFCRIFQSGTRDPNQAFSEHFDNSELFNDIKWFAVSN